MAEDIGTLRRRHGVTKAKLTKLTSRIERIRESDEVSREQIEECIANLERIRIGFERVQEEIIEDRKEGHGCGLYRGSVFRRHFDLKVTLNQMLRNLPAPQSETRSSTNDEGYSSNNPS